MERATVERAIPGVGAARLTLEVYEEAGQRIAGVYQLRGKIDAHPKQWLRLVRAELKNLETVAKSVGCAEMRMAGRDWSRVFPDYERLDGGPVPNLLRKRL